MKITDIKKREELKLKYKNRIFNLQKEIDFMIKTKQEFPENDQSPRNIIGYATALCDLDEETKEIIFNSLSEDYEDENIRLNKGRIKQLKEEQCRALRKF